MVRSMLRALLLAVVAAAAGAAQAAPPRFTKAPLIVANPNQAVPLAALVRFSTDKPVRATLDVTDGSWTRRLSFTEGQNTTAGLPIIGMRPGQRIAVSVTITDAEGASITSPTKLEFVAPALPADRFQFPPIQVYKAEPARMEPGYTILSVRRENFTKTTWRTQVQERFARRFGLLVMLNNAGEVIWYYKSDSRIAGVERLHNGNILFNLQDFRSVEIDLLGNIVREYYARDRPEGPQPGAVPLEAQTLHHQPREMPNGNFLIFSANARKIDNYYSSEFDPNAPRKTQMVVGDRILEVDRKTGKEIWSWNTFDHLDPFRIGYQLLDVYWHTRGFPNHADWTHGNGLAYDPRDDSVIASFRLQDAIMKIDRKSGRIKWILGEDSDWGPLADKVLKPVGEPFRWPYHAHNPVVSPAGTLVVFDNGVFGARPFAKFKAPNEVYSRGVEYDIDEKAMTVRQLWQSADKLDEDSCNSWAMGDAARLPQSGNMLVIYAMCVAMRPGTSLNENDPGKDYIGFFPGSGPRVQEFTRTTPTEVLYDVRMRDPDDLIEWNVFGGQRIPDLYPPGMLK